jgi:hypothetical protein
VKDFEQAVRQGQAIIGVAEPIARAGGSASQFLNSGGKFSLAPGFSPVMMVEKRRKAVLTASVCRETR